MYDNSNNNSDFLSYRGRISRKNYIINVLILLTLYILTSLVNFNAFAQFFSFEFFNTILTFLVEFFKFVLVVSLISVVYRRINDCTNFDGIVKNVFVIFYFIPFLYLSFGHYMLDFMPGILRILDLETFFILLPGAVIATIVFAIIKSK